MVETIKKKFHNKIVINNLLNLIIIDSFSEIGNYHLVENLSSEKMIRDLSESYHFSKFGKKRYTLKKQYS